MNNSELVARPITHTYEITVAVSYGLAIVMIACAFYLVWSMLKIRGVEGGSTTPSKHDRLRATLRWTGLVSAVVLALTFAVLPSMLAPCAPSPLQSISEMASPSPSKLSVSGCSSLWD